MSETGHTGPTMCGPLISEFALPLLHKLVAFFIDRNTSCPQCRRPATNGEFCDADCQDEWEKSTAW